MSEEQIKDHLDEFKEPDFEKLLCGIDITLTNSFFHYFSRFEHALKIYNERYREVSKKGYLIGVKWPSFIEDCNELYPSKSKKLNDAVEYICNNPTMRQLGDLNWEKNEALTPSFCNALSQIPNIRNNIFHGGKYFKPDKKRDEALIQSAIVLMQVCLDSLPELFRAFKYTGT